LNPGDFLWSVHIGSSNDVVQEDVIAGNVHLSQPKLTITKAPDLSLCPNDLGQWTLTVTNDGNATVNGIVVSDVLPAGVTFDQVISGGVTASGSGTISFSAFDLGQCESKTIVYQVKANDNCSGDGVNSASALGHFSSFCAGNGTLTTTDVSAGP